MRCLLKKTGWVVPNIIKGMVRKNQILNQLMRKNLNCEGCFDKYRKIIDTLQFDYRTGITLDM